MIFEHANKKNWFTSQRKPITINLGKHSFLHSPHSSWPFPLWGPLLCRYHLDMCVSADIQIYWQSICNPRRSAESSLSKARNMYSGEHYMIQISGTQGEWWRAASNFGLRRLHLASAANCLPLDLSRLLRQGSHRRSMRAKRKICEVCTHSFYLFIFLSLSLCAALQHTHKGLHAHGIRKCCNLILFWVSITLCAAPCILYCVEYFTTMASSR
jgi:hypothetical protein